MTDTDCLSDKLDKIHYITQLLSHELLNYYKFYDVDKGIASQDAIDYIVSEAVAFRKEQIEQ